jgi:hypothetical protein
MDKWQPIASAPRNATVIATNGIKVFLAIDTWTTFAGRQWCSHGLCLNDQHQPVLWQPVPPLDAPQWKTMRRAPKDGTSVMLTNGYVAFDGAYEHGGWGWGIHLYRHPHIPTRFMRYPSPPKDVG